MMEWQVNHMSEYSRINELIETYIKVVQALITVQAGSKKIYIQDSKKDHVHFRASDFKKILSETISQKSRPTEYMKNFRTLQFIICETNRFTNTRYINGKTTRVITVDLNKYILLKGMLGS